MLPEYKYLLQSQDSLIRMLYVDSNTDNKLFGLIKLDKEAEERKIWVFVSLGL